MGFTEDRRIMRWLAALLVALLTGDAGSGVAAAGAQNVADESWELLIKALPGARVRLTLTDGADVEGRLVDARTDAVVLSDNAIRRGSLTTPTGTSLADALTYSRSTVASVKVSKQSNPEYRLTGSGAPDEAAVRRVAALLGVGSTVDVATKRTKSLRAKIESIDQNSFTVAHGRSRTSMVIGYGEVTRFKRAGMSARAKVGIALAIYPGIPLLILFGCLATNPSQNCIG